MAVVTVKELIESGVHFGHQARLWNPKMRSFIHGKKNKIHVIDLKETVRGLLRGRHFLYRLAAAGAQILFVGTKRQIKEVVAGEAERVNMPVVIERWIGGTLTNYHTIRSRLDRLDDLEKLEVDGTFEKHSKKAQSMMRREMRKIRRNLGGVRNLEGLPGAMVVIDPKHEEIAVKEAAKMNVPVVAILDTDCDPDWIDIPIPGNDDALRSVQLLLTSLVDSIVEGKQNMVAEANRFRSEVPQIRGREEQRGRAGGRSGGRSGGRRGGPPPRSDAGGARSAPGGRFADKRSGTAESVSFGRQTEEEVQASKAVPADKPAEGSTPPAAQPDAAQPDAVQPPTAQPDAAKPDAPSSGSDANPGT